METDGSPASIFATLDWLDPMRLAKSICVIPLFLRSIFTIWLKFYLVSTV